MNEQKIMNKTMDLEDINGSDEALAVVDELNSLIKQIKARNLKISSWYGVFNLTGDANSCEWINRGYGYEGIEGAIDDKNFSWFLYWEIVWIVLNNEFYPEQKVLDLGGSSSLFSYYLASKGVDVTTIDLQKELVDNANFVAKQMGWNLKNYVMNMRELNFDSKFDHITSICVYEHLPMYDRVTINKNIEDLLVERGKFSITFDYRNPSRFAQINSPKDIYEQFVKPSGLKIRGNKDFLDNGKNYLLNPFYYKYKRRLWKYIISSIRRRHLSPLELFRIKESNDYTFGALFLEK
ncbi:MAG: methyltransferase domain-containing protein [Candidatus Brocadiaceae bacterium]|nr:methyltransferase domain-containing protein [Candidatus Brocadiaceae bacterium]